MNRDALPPPEPDPRRPSLESLEEKLRALPLAAVPAGLPSKLIAAIPPTTVVSSPGSGVRRLWPWIGAVGVICITASAVVFSWLVHLNSQPGAASNEDRSPTTNEKETPTSSKAVQDFEQAVQ